MLRETNVFSSFSVNDTEKAKKFYQQKLGLDVSEIQEMNILQLKLPGGGEVVIYPKGEHHQPAIFTVLNFVVKNIDKSVDELTSHGIKFEQYNNTDLPQDEKGIMRGLKSGNGPDIAWFKDPAGNILSILQESE